MGRVKEALLQGELFKEPPDVTFTDPAVPSEAVPRLGGQNALLLERLRKGPATNVELERVSGSRRINSRVADVRRWLQKNEMSSVESSPVDVSKGIYEYRITPCG